MNEKYLYGKCHVCSCAISIPGLEAYYCPDCQKWLAYSNSKKFNFSSQTPTKISQQKHLVSSPEQASLNLSRGES